MGCRALLDNPKNHLGFKISESAFQGNSNSIFLRVMGCENARRVAKSAICLLSPRAPYLPSPNKECPREAN